jgi:two-component system sensor histidine kinase/response regulator
MAVAVPRLSLAAPRPHEDPAATHAALAAALGERLLEDTRAGELVPLALALTLIPIVGSPPWSLLAIPWLTLILLAAGLRAAARFRFLQSGRPVPDAPGALRWTFLLTALAWAVGPAALGGVLPFDRMVLLMLVVAGVTAGGSGTLLADRLGFHAVNALPVAGVVVGVLRGGLDQIHLMAAVLAIVFGVLLILLYERNHASLRRELMQAHRLQISEADAAQRGEYLDALLLSAPTAIATVGSDGRVVGVNPAFEQLFGYTAAEAVGHLMNDLVVPQGALESALALEEQARRGRSVTFETERCRKDGRLVPVRIAAALVRGVGDGTIFVLYDDITATRNAERALREAERQYRELVESASDLVWQLDADGRWTFVNRAAREIYGVSAEDLLGRPFVDRVDPEHVARDRAAFQRVLAGGELSDYETVHRDVAGEPRHLAFAARPIRDAAGRVTGAHGTARDVTDRARARAGLEEARDAAVRLAALRSAFMANMSHEIRTPMNGVLGLADLLLDTELTPEQRRSLDLLHGSAQALLGVIDDILDFSKIEAGQLELEQIPFDLPGLVDATVRLLAVRAAGRGLELLADVQRGVPRVVRGDPGRLRQVLTNLLGNAIKFTERGEVAITVKPEGEPADGSVRLCFAVRDSGIGIPRERIAAIFEEFIQVDSSTTRRFGGTGLGLAISRRLVELMGGELAVQSEVGVGSEFAFVIPLGVEADTAALAARAPLGYRGLHVLIVDDNAANRRILRGMLEDAGLVVGEAGGADEALRQLRGARGADTFRLAVIDSQMPGRDGFDFAGAVKGDPATADTRLLMLTSAGRRGDGRRCRELGVQGYLTKPVSRLELLEAIASVLSGTERIVEVVTRHSMAESRRRLRVLVAEDNPVNQEVARALLQRRGHDVTVVENGRLALEAVRRDGFDVVLMDVQMPEMDGISATREIRALPAHAEVPIIAVTAHALAEEHDRCMAAGMQACVVKPFRPDTLFAAVEGWGGSGETPETGGQAVSLEGPAVDVAGLRRSMGEAGATEIVPQLLAAFLADAPGRMAAVETAAEAGDPQGISQAAHAYKSASGAISATALAEALRRLEQAGKAEDLAAARPLVIEVRARHEAALAQLRREVEE